MIILKQIQLNNFLSHADTNIAFGDNDKILIDGKSGSGKSSIIEAIIWGLYGEARVENRSLVKHGAKSGSVTINLIDDTTETFYEIKRGTSDKAKNTLTVGQSPDGITYRPIERNGIRDVQEWIEKELLHASYTLFINSIAYPQDNINNFVKQTATKRKDLLLEIANVGDFDLYYNRARDIFTLKNEEKIRINTGISTNLSFIEKQKESIIEEDAIQDEINGLELSMDTEAKKLEDISVQKKIIVDSVGEINKLKSQVFSKHVEMATLSEQIIRKSDVISSIESFDIQSIKDKITEGKVLKEKKVLIEDKINKDYERTSKLNAILSDKPADRDYDGEIAEINKRLIPLVKETGKCPSGDSCPFTIPIQNQITYLSEQINEKIMAKAALEKQKDTYKARILTVEPSTLLPEERAEYDRLKTLIVEYDKYEALLAAKEVSFATLPTLKGEYTEMLIRQVSLQEEINGLSEDLKKKTDMQSVIDTTGLDAEENNIRNRLNSLSSIVKDLSHKIFISKESRKRIAEIEMTIKLEQETLLKVEKNIESISMIKDAFGAKGLKIVVIDYLIPRLEDKINEILSRLSEFRVQLDTQKGTADGAGTIEGLFINIFNERGEQFEFSSYSGGERLKITVAISEALASLQKCGFRIFDELFIGLDEESVEHFAEVMNRLQEKFKQMLCISHLRTIKDLFDNKIVITKINGVSQTQ